jgi:hypothetical protein
MTRNVRRRFWFEVGGAVFCAVLACATLITREWIEGVFRFDPDGGSGLVEWGVVVVAVTLTAVFSFLARHDLRAASSAAL